MSVDEAGNFVCLPTVEILDILPTPGIHNALVHELSHVAAASSKAAPPTILMKNPHGSDWIREMERLAARGESWAIQDIERQGTP
ncbi:MAG TPA: hypothetical protein VIV15_03630 [Anaerolineales bacterium]